MILKKTLESQLNEKNAEIDRLNEKINNLDTKKGELQLALEQMQETEENLKKISGMVDKQPVTEEGPPKLTEVNDDNVNDVFTQEKEQPIDTEQISVKLDGNAIANSDGMILLLLLMPRLN